MFNQQKCLKMEKWKLHKEALRQILIGIQRDNDQIVISSTVNLSVLNSYIASDSPFSISSITEEFWYAGTFDLVKNQEDLLKIYQKNKLTYCSLMKEQNVLEHYNLELQYKHNDFIDFNRRNNINC